MVSIISDSSAIPAIFAGLLASSAITGQRHKADTTTTSIRIIVLVILPGYVKHDLDNYQYY